MHLTSAPLVAWGNAWLSGHVGLDDAVDAVERRGGPSLIGTVPAADLPFDSGVPLRVALARLRGLGLSAFRLALPAWGDPLGLVGPKELNQAAVEAQEGVLVQLADRQVGLVPAADRRGSSYVGVAWTPYPANSAPPQVPGLAEAEQALKLTVIEVAGLMEGVDDIASFAPGVHRRLDGPDGREAPSLARGYPARAHRVVAQAERLAKVVELAEPSSGRGMTAQQVSARSEALRRLDSAVRRALVAAHASIALPGLGSPRP
ncbi:MULTISPECIES: hypothetical protein [Nocardiopsis]|uniref:Uncharacterized protein n=1 Tax=Nocardiopsis sinuspersici TaxID=501010 RepID=A0A1V3C5Q3_9ACTN|nr:MULTISPECIES: hypothetical protein [Nocardiopsis]NYH52551.1 hypothetical protein [Nocardiopsis sinuspersici]OOC56023.1 hypothetical protein NOSIN_21095 [Nocardiopsis sinuspersici]